MGERCRTCRFWLLDLEPGEVDQGEEYDAGFGWCRRHPPKIIDRMARMTIQPPLFGGHNYDPEDVANGCTVSAASLFPATFGTNWCGEYIQKEIG